MTRSYALILSGRERTTGIPYSRCYLYYLLTSGYPHERVNVATTVTATATVTQKTLAKSLKRGVTTLCIEASFALTGIIKDTLWQTTS